MVLCFPVHQADPTSGSRSRLTHSPSGPSTLSQFVLTGGEGVMPFLITGEVLFYRALWQSTQLIHNVGVN